MVGGGRGKGRSDDAKWRLAFKQTLVTSAHLVIVRNEKVRGGRVEAAVQIEHPPPHVHMEQVVVPYDERHSA